MWGLAGTVSHVKRAIEPFNRLEEYIGGGVKLAAPYCIIPLHPLHHVLVIASQWLCHSGHNVLVAIPLLCHLVM